ncbi:MAG: DUF86 domain-containing protein [Candidatus Rokubacteria bacterium]|nr:DUF86 domain-containing protein [Candidatus Rokubacteria bacterium]
MIDPELVIRKIVLITGDLDRLGALAATPLADYLASPTDELVAERLLERIIGRMIDVNYHLLTESGQPPPRDYYDSFTELAKLEVLSPDFAARIAACAGLRNRIAHEYDEIDPAKVHEALQNAVKDIPEYLRRVQAFVTRA